MTETVIVALAMLAITLIVRAIAITVRGSRPITGRMVGTINGKKLLDVERTVKVSRGVESMSASPVTYAYGLPVTVAEHSIPCPRGMTAHVIGRTTFDRAVSMRSGDSLSYDAELTYEHTADGEIWPTKLETLAARVERADGRIEPITFRNEPVE